VKDSIKLWLVNALKAFTHHNLPDLNAATLPIDTAINSDTYAVGAAVYQTMKISLDFWYSFKYFS